MADDTTNPEAAVDPTAATTPASDAPAAEAPKQPEDPTPVATAPNPAKAPPPTDRIADLEAMVVALKDRLDRLESKLRHMV